MIRILELLAVLVVYLGIGTLYARANSTRCYQAAAKRWATCQYQREQVITQSYRERLLVHAVAWVIVWPLNRVTAVVTAPVGDLEAAYRSWADYQQRIELGRKELEQ
ncbi:MAG: hypothetical protein JWO67_6492 [Streptosporangiaceae bacterium]|nr:hypothetical protein [Streptosporangiaceae bacterium]